MVIIYHVVIYYYNLRRTWENDMKTFGEFVIMLRKRNRITLREFCRLTKIDPSNWSKIERGILSPPKSQEVLDEIAQVLHLKKKSEEYYLLNDLAAISFIPKELMSDDELLDKLPVFFRTLRGQPPSNNELDELIKIIKEE